MAARKIFGNRVFTDANHGFALVDTGQAQYPAATVNGGKTWKTNGPALHLNAAQAPLAVIYIGAAGQKTIFAWGTGQVIDTTSNGGKQWYRALFFGLPVAVVKNPQGHLVAFVDGETSGSVDPAVRLQERREDLAPRQHDRRVLEWGSDPSPADGAGAGKRRQRQRAQREQLRIAGIAPIAKADRVGPRGDVGSDQRRRDHRRRPRATVDGGGPAVVERRAQHDDSRAGAS